jgi:hypothetical protein
MRKLAKTPDALEAQRLRQARLPAALVREFRILAPDQDVTVRELLTRIVREYLAQQGRPPGRRG